MVIGRGSTAEPPHDAAVGGLLAGAPGPMPLDGKREGGWVYREDVGRLLASHPGEMLYHSAGPVGAGAAAGRTNTVGGSKESAADDAAWIDSVQASVPQPA